ncbi:MAG: potassium channel family protein [Candidatus Hodarchaeota archaeon]
MTAIRLRRAWTGFVIRLKAVGDRAKRQNLVVMHQIWRDEYPPEDHKEHTFLEKILISLPLVARTFSLSNLVAFFRSGGRPGYLFIDLYLLLWVSALTLMLFAWTPKSVAVALVAAYRIVDVVSYQLCIILVDSQKANWRLASVRRSFLFSMVNLFEIVTAFAIIYLVVGNIVENKPDGATIQTPLLAFYYSLVTVATLGYGEFVPKDDPSRCIVILQIVTEVLFLLAVIPAFVANLVTQLGGREWKTPSRRQ